MSQTPKAAFQDAKSYVRSDKDPAMFSMLAGLIRLAEQLEDMDYRLRKIETAVDDLKRR